MKPQPKRKPKHSTSVGSEWVRAGTVWAGPSFCQLDLSDNQGNWITIKGRNDRLSEHPATVVLRLLNANGKAIRVEEKK